MTIPRTDARTPQQPLRLWPGAVVALLMALGGVVLPFVPEGALYAVMAGALGGVLVLVWWLFFSKAPWAERVGAIVLMIVALFATSRVVHQSISNGMMGLMLPIYAVPVLSLALVAWALASRRLSPGARRTTMVATVLLACGAFTLVRTGGITGGVKHDLHWRWTPTPEERLLAQGGDEPPPPPSAPALAETPETSVPTAAGDRPLVPTPHAPAAGAPTMPASSGAGDEAPSLSASTAAAETRADWPGFRGAERDDVVRGVRIETDWTASPPAKLWSRPIGPGWSSFAVRGNLFYTQEQRGDDEVVSAYSLTTGEPVWRHRDTARFWESNGGAGPRGTPTLSNGRLYSLGATGILNALNARDGSVVWSRNAATDTGATLPGWGFAGSPLVVNDVVIVATSGRLAAYDVATGKPRWTRATGGGGYSSPQHMTIDGVGQILLTSGGGASSIATADGTPLWEYRSQGSATSILQPALLTGGDVLIAAVDSSASGVGVRRLAVAQGPGGWKAEERWTSRGLKPSFSDFVVHKGHAFGFDGSILASIDLTDGTRTWKGGRYGQGQLVLLADQDLLLVLSEEGDLALVSARADQFSELARVPAIEGKTWNHPVLVGNILLVRNGEEMAAFRLSLAGR